jgi:hypothetical protein
MKKKKEEKLFTKLNPKREHFCRNYTQNSQFYSNATLSYAFAYGFDLDSQSHDDARYEMVKDEEGKMYQKRVEKSSYDKMFDMCSAAGSRLLRDVKVQKRNIELLNEILTDENIDARLAHIALYSDPRDSINAIKEFNKLKQRIIERVDHTTKGEPMPIYAGNSIGKKL